MFSYIIFKSENFTHYYFLAVFSAPIYYIIMQNYAIEIYSTSMRDKALTLLSFVNKLGAVGGQFVFLFLSNKKCFYALLLSY